jgi:hypothetical protein
MTKKEDFQSSSLETLVQQNNKLFHTLEIFFIIAMLVIFVFLYYMNTHLNHIDAHSAHIDTHSAQFSQALKFLSQISANTGMVSGMASQK